MVEKKPAGASQRYLLGSILGIFGIIGIVVFVLFLFRQINEQAPKIQVIIPGTHLIELNETGTYTIFYEYRSVIDSKVYMTGASLPSEVLVTLYNKGKDQKVDLKQPAMNNTYNIGGRAGVSLLEFTIDNSGTYIIDAKYASDISKPDIVFAIGRFRLFKVIFGAIGIFFISLILIMTGCVIVLITYLKNRKIKKETKT